MIAGLALAGLFGLGLWLILTSLPWAERRPDLAFELRRLSAQGRMEIESERQRAAPPMFVSPLLERTLRPLLDDAGRLVGRLLTRLGIRTADLEQRLVIGWAGMTSSQFFGQKVAVGLLFLAILPALNFAGLQPFGAWPAWTWLGAGLVGFILPDWLLDRRVARRRQQVLMELPTVLDLLAMATSAGLSPEQAVLDVSRQVHGVLGDGLSDVAREAGLGAATHAEGLHALATREGVPEIATMADAWQSALEQGLPLGQVMLQLANTVRERKRAHLIAEGEKASVRMIFPVALFVFPTFLVVLLYPAGVQLLGLGE
ncbi:MAG: type II secretion system F family protein [Dehalococcoidia bacterium]|nr:type II secretion system F family protein [Dehalococcoidia bacterium]